MNNIFSQLPISVTDEIFQDIVKGEHVRIERILSQGQTSPEEGWYDQEENEWVVVLQGGGTIEFEDGSSVMLGLGDFHNIPAHKKHRVSWTDPNQITVWLAIFYQ